MFILLYTGEEQQWEFCLLEAGLFRAFYPDRPLVVFHDPSTPIPKAFEDLNAVTVTVEHVMNFVAPIFYDPPWEVNPRLRRETLMHLAEALVKTFNYDKHVVTNFDLVPSFTLEMVASDSSRGSTSTVGFSVSVAAELKRSAPPAASPPGQPAVKSA